MAAPTCTASQPSFVVCFPHDLPCVVGLEILPQPAACCHSISYFSAVWTTAIHMHLETDHCESSSAISYPHKLPRAHLSSPWCPPSNEACVSNTHRLHEAQALNLQLICFGKSRTWYHKSEVHVYRARSVGLVQDGIPLC